MFRHETDRGSILQAWTEAQDWYSAARYGAVSIDYSSSREEEVENRSLPAGVADAIRTEGTDRYWNVPVGIGLYAIEPDIIALILVRGTIYLSEGDKTGAFATDYVADIAVKKILAKS